MSLLGQIMATTAQIQDRRTEKQPATQSSLPFLEQNTIVRGEIIDLRRNQVVIQLPDGEQLSARLEGSLELSIGQKADFLASQSEENTVTLKLIQPSSEETPVIDKILHAAGLQKNEKTISIVKELLAHQQPVTEGNIRQHLMLSAKYPKLPVQDLVLMKLHRLPVTEETVSGFLDYRQGAHSLIAQRNDLIASICEQIFSLTEPDTGDLFAEKLLSLITAHTTDVPDDLSASHTAARQGEPSASYTAIMQDGRSATHTAAIQDGHSATHTAAIQDALSATHTAARQEELPAAQAPSDSAKTSAELSASSQKHRSLRVLKDYLSEHPAENDRKNLWNRYLLSPEETADEEQIRNSYRQLQEELNVLEKISNELAALTKKESSVSSVKQLRTNLSFMEQLNQIFPYIQLPLKLSGSPAHAELYVYEKKRTRSEQDPLRALLHLELPALGTADIYLTLTASFVSARFSLSNESSEKLVQQELPSLVAALEKKGYSVQAEILPHGATEKDGPVPSLLEQFLEQNSPSGVGRYTFDIRA